MENAASDRLSIPISREDLAHFHSEIVMATATGMAGVTRAQWKYLAAPERARWLGKSLDLLVIALADRAAVERLPLLHKGLVWRL